MADNEVTLSNTNTIDMDALMSDSFDPKTFIAPNRSGGFDAAAGIVGQDEYNAAFKFQEFMKQVGVEEEARPAYTTAASSVLNSSSAKDTWDSIKEGYNNNSIDMQKADRGWQFIQGLISFDQMVQATDDLEKQKTNTLPSNWFASLTKSAANQVPTLIKTMEGASMWGAIGAGVGAGVALVAGNAGPQALTAEESVTVPAAAMTGLRIGSMVGGIDAGWRINAGLEAVQMASIRDANGRKLDPEIIRRVSNVVGAFNGVIEVAQAKKYLATIPGVNKLVQKASNETMRRLFQSKLLTNFLTKNAAKYAGTVSFETLTEVEQEVSAIVGEEFSKQLNNQIAGTNFGPTTAYEISTRLRDIATETIKASSVLAFPGHVIQTVGDAGTMPKAYQPDAAFQEPVSRVSRILSSEKIAPRVDVFELGKPVEAVTLEGEADASHTIEKPKAKPTDSISKLRKQASNLEIDVTELEKLEGKERRAAYADAVNQAAENRPLKNRGTAPLTPEESFTLQQSEATLAATENLTVTPNLYIGNVTQRMKESAGEALGVAPERVHGFTENGITTNRTKIALTQDEARGLLFMLENSLQERLDKNQIATHSDMAKANADWGDVKELRKVLGLPTVPRPFQVIKEPGTKIVTLLKTKERVTKTVTPSQGDIVQTTQIDRLNNVMRQIVKATGEGYQLGKSEMKKLYAELQYLRKQKQLRERLLEKIQKEPSERVDFFYREAIIGLQNSLDFDADTAKSAETKAKTKAFLDTHPDKYGDMPSEVIAKLQQKNIGELSYADLTTIHNEIERLKTVGESKSDAVKAERAAKLETFASDAVAGIKKAPKFLVPIAEKARYLVRSIALRGLRLFDMMDGGKDFKGPLANFFYWTTNENTNAELRNVDARHEALKVKLEELGLSFGDLRSERTIDGITLTVDEWISIYAGWKNKASQAALKYGGFEHKVDGKMQHALVTDELYGQIDAALTDKEKLVGDMVIAENAEHYDRMRNAVIRAENRDPGHEVNYTKIRRKGVQYTSSEQEMMDELAYRHFIRQNAPSKGFTLDRKNIPAEYQKPIELGLTKIWLGEVPKQEHYINHALHLKDMRALANRPDFRTALTERFGEQTTRFIDHYIDTIANPDIYKAKTGDVLETASRTARKHVAIVYIGYRLLSIAKQIPSSLMYWAHSSAGDMIQASVQTALHPLKMYERAKEIHYQLSRNVLDREIQEFHQADASAYKKIINKIGSAGMFGIFAADRATRVIGINAVYDKAIRDGLSPSEAAHKAAKVTLMNQESSHAKDLARAYTSNEYLNWVTMFTNQLNQVYNIATYDIPSAWRNAHYQDAARSAFALATMASLIWMIDNRKFPEEPEDLAAAVSDQAISSIPIVGTYAASGMKGWSPSAPAPLQAASGVGKAAKAVKEGDYEKAVKALWEPASIMTGVPYQVIRDANKFLEE